MSDKLLKFTSVDQAQPDKRDAAARARDFFEIHQPYVADKAAEQAARCSQCGVPFCQSGCPLQNNIPDWLQLAAEGRLEEAYEVSAATNPMPEVCGRICPQDRLCEGACVINTSGHGAVTIGAVEKHLTDTAWEEGWVQPIPVGRDRGQSVAIIGAGPAGMAAAERLRNRGYGVTVYDRYDRAGGLLIYGIPHFKLDKDVVIRRADRLTEAGVAFELNADVGRTHAFSDIRARHDAVLLATGVYKARALNAPGAGGPGVVAAMDFLTRANRLCLGDADMDPALDAQGKRVVVVGGGDTAMDCVRTAVRQGATTVTCLYRRDRANMPGSAREVRSAEEEGVVFEWLAAPKAVVTGENGPTQLKAARMRLGAPDASGRQRPEETPGGAFDVPAEMIVQALGFEGEDLPAAFGEPGLAVTPDGRVRVDAQTIDGAFYSGCGMTAVPGVFAAGDIARGASLVVWALRDGLEVAERIHKDLRAQKTAPAHAPNPALAAE